MYLLVLIALECLVYVLAKNWQHSLKKDREDDSDLKQRL